MSGKIDIRMGGRYRDRDESVSSAPGGNEALRELIRELISETPVSWNNIYGDITTNTEFKNYIDKLVDLMNLNIFNSGGQITQQMIDYFTALTNQIDVINNWITTNANINQEFKNYVDARITELEQYITTNMILGAAYTAEIKNYIDARVSDFYTIVNELGVTLTESLQQYITNVINQGGEATRLISGTVTWLQNLNFLISPLVYQILNNRYKSVEETITIPANVANNPMFALIVADTSGNVSVVLGTPAASPAFPLINSSTQILITPVYIPALGTAPVVDPGGQTGTIVTEVIYNENIEWTTAKVEEPGAAINLANTTAPALGTKHISLSLSGGVSNYTKSALITGEGIISKIVNIEIDQLQLNLILSELFAAHKTDYTTFGIRHLVYYNYRKRNMIRAHLINIVTGAGFDIFCNLATSETFAVPVLGFSVNVPLQLTLPFNGNVIPTGAYQMTLFGLQWNDQQYTAALAPTISPVAAAMSFTRATAIDAIGGNISLSLKTLVPWAANTGLLFELYNGLVKIGTLVLLPGNLYGFNPQNITDYQRITLPIAAFNPTASQITKIVIRPVNEWPNGSLFLDNLVLQTGVKVNSVPQIQVDWSQTNPLAIDFIKNKPTIPAAQIQSDWTQATNTEKDFIKNKPTIPAAQIQSDWTQATNTEKDFIKNKPTIPVVGTIAIKDYWTGTAAAYAAINPKLANTIYFVEE